MSVQNDFKLSAIECWTADPCDALPGTPGSAPYAGDLVAQRTAYAGWMATELDYEGSTGLDVLDVGWGQGIDFSFLRSPAFLDRAGRVAGWYVIARGVKS